MLFVVALSLVFLPVAVDRELEASRQLDAIERAYTQQAGARSMEAAEALIARASGTQASGRALVWLGAIAASDHRDELAQRRFTDARRSFPHGEINALASRGLGDVALYERRFGDAIVFYEEALAEAPPLLERELTEKRALARRERDRRRLEWIAWAALALCSAWLARGAKHWARVIPRETRMLVPVYAVMLAVAWGRDPNVPVAMAWIAAGSLLLVTLAFARGENARSRSAGDACALAIGTASVICIGLCRSGILDALVETVRGASAL